MLLKEKNNIVFSQSINFKHSWRVYQKKFLENFDKHKLDNHLHVIAPPGAGKTILGLEMLIRVNKKTLVLTPTLTIKHQWKDKFKEFFDVDNTFSRISDNIKQLEDLNFSTYQGLFSLRKNFETSESFLEHFKGVEVLVLDEAHHLKTEWWKVLFELKENTNITIIALTATPPFDSTKVELGRYFKLCGEVDEEISIPELVKERALCPHQDFIHFSKPNDNDIEYIFTYRKRIATFIQFLKENRSFIQLVKNHPLYLNTEENIELIYDDPSYYSAILIFLNEQGEFISSEKLELLGFDKEETISFPVFDRNWAEILLQKLLFEDREALTEFEETLSKVEKDLKNIGGIHQKKINLLSNDTIFKKITHSSNKLNGVVSIVNFEEKQLKDNLRLVVLTDFIRKEYLGLNENYTKQITKIGVIPIFHYLKKYIQNNSSIAVLTGSLVIVNKSALESLNGSFQNNLNIKTIENTNDFVELVFSDSVKNRVVNVITSLFEQGVIKILIGTKSLLGEGWDAPSINTLILASNIGSFVSSNQMRGRAIRVKGSFKTGHIWHLASLDISNELGGEDIAKLEQRFSAFVGLDYNNYVIKNGIDRLDIPSVFNEASINYLNNKTFERATNRNQLIEDWDRAIENGYEVKKIVSIDYSLQNEFQKFKASTYKNTVKSMFVELGIGISYFTYEYVVNNLIHALKGNIIFLLKYFIISLFIAFLPRTFKAVRTYFILGNVNKLIKKIGEAVLFSMNELAYLKTNFNSIKISVETMENGALSCSLVGASYFENSLFVTSVNEILMPLDNPRYVIIRKNWMKSKIGIYNVHAVPSIFDSNKKTAEVFYKNWKRSVGKSELIFSRNIEGRKLLLKAKMQNLNYVSSKENTSKTEILWK